MNFLERLLALITRPRPLTPVDQSTSETDQSRAAPSMPCSNAMFHGVGTVIIAEATFVMPIILFLTMSLDKSICNQATHPSRHSKPNSRRSEHRQAGTQIEDERTQIVVLYSLVNLHKKFGLTGSQNYLLILL